MGQQLSGNRSGSHRQRRQQQHQQQAAAIAKIREFFQNKRFTPEDLKGLLPHVQQAINSNDNDTQGLNTDVSSDTVQQVSSFLDTVSREASTSVQIQDYKRLPLKEAAESTLEDVLVGVGSVHWIACGLSLVAYILKLRGQTKENKEAIESILKKIKFTAQEIIGLAPQFTNCNNNINAEEFLKDATKEIATIALECCLTMGRRKLPRIIFAKVDAKNLQQIQKNLEDIRMQLIAITGPELLNRVPPPASKLTPFVEKHTVDMNARVQKVMGLINSDVYVIVLYGMGGVGKTTLMRAVEYALMETERERYSYHRIKLSENPEVPIVQKSLLESLTGRAARVNDTEDGRAQLAEALLQNKDPQKQLLICIDNVWKGEHVTELLPEEIISYPCNVKVLITSRNGAISDAFRTWEGFETSRVMIHKVDFLSRESSEMLLKKALRIDVASTSNQITSLGEEEQMLFDRLLTVCNGHPLAIRMAGTYIEAKERARDAWERAISRMTNVGWDDTLGGDREDRLSEHLNYVLDSLSEAVKRAFLDIVALFIPEEGRFVSFNEVGYYVGSLALRDLEDRCLVDRDHHYLKVHDLLVAMAKCNTPRNSRLITMTELLDVLRRENATDLNDVEAIFVEGWGVDEVLESEKNLWEGIAKMPNLRILTLPIRYDVERQFGFDLGISPRVRLSALSLNTFWLRCFPCKLACQQLTVLELKFQRSTVQETWCNCIKWEDLKALKKLSLVGASQCVVNSLDESCVGIKWGSLLEELYLEGEFERLPRNFQGLRNLRRLSISSSHKEDRACMELPQGMQDLVCLESLYISGPLVEMQPQDLQGHPALATLELRGCKGVVEALADLDVSQQLSNSLTKLTLYECNDLPDHSVPPALGKLSKLRELGLWYCRDLEVFPEGICGHLQALRQIEVLRCDKLSYWPRDLGSSRSLAIKVPKNIRELASSAQHVGVNLNNPVNTRLPTIRAEDFRDVADEVMQDMAQYPKAEERRVRAVNRLLQDGKLIDQQGNELPPCATVSLLRDKVIGLLFVEGERNWRMDGHHRPKPLPDDVKSICEELAKQHKEMHYVVVQDPYCGYLWLDGEWRPYLPVELPDDQHWVSVSTWDPTTRAALALAFRHTIQADGSREEDPSIARASNGRSFVFTVFKEGHMHTQWDALAKFGWWRGEAYPFTEERMKSLNSHLLGSYLRPTDFLVNSNGKEIKVDDCQLSGKPTIFFFCTSKGLPLISWLLKNVPCCMANIIYFQDPWNDGYMPISSPWLRYPTRDSELMERMWRLFGGVTSWEYTYRMVRVDRMVIFDEQGNLLHHDGLDALLLLGGTSLLKSTFSLEAQLDRLLMDSDSFRNVFIHGCDTFIHQGQERKCVDVEAVGFLFVGIDDTCIPWLTELKDTYMTMNETNKVFEIVHVDCRSKGGDDFHEEIPWLVMPRASSQVLRMKLRAIFDRLLKTDASGPTEEKWLWVIIHLLWAINDMEKEVYLLVLGADGQPRMTCGDSLVDSHGCKSFFPISRQSI